MRIAIFANGILFNKVGGAQKHMREVIERFPQFYDIVYFPEPQTFKEKGSCDFEYIKYLNTLNIKISGYFIDFSGKEVSIQDIIEHYSMEIENCDFIYDLDFQYYAENFKYGGELSLTLSRRMDKKMGACLQDLGDVNMHFFHELYSGFALSLVAPRLSLFIAGISIYDYINRKLTLKKLISNKNLEFISIVNNSYKRNMHIQFKNVYRLEPSNALDTKIKKYRGLEKENKIIFFARLVYRKGIFDFIHVVKDITKNSDVKVIIAGEFQHEFEKTYFFSLLSKYELNESVKYLGKLKDDELYQELSTASLMIYPSHSDSFSLSILQAIYLGTPVVAYDIAGISLYKNFSCVKLVKEFDIRKMVEISRNMLSNKNISFNNATLEDFINQHQDWGSVANAHKKIIDAHLQ